MRNIVVTLGLYLLLGAFADPTTAQPAPAPQPPAVAAVAAVAASPVTPAFAWKVERRFRLWDLPALTAGDQAAAEALYDALAGSSDTDKAHDLIVAFVKSHRALTRGYWNEDARTFSIAFLYPQTYAVRIGLSNGLSLAGQTCTWSTSAGHLDQATARCENSVDLSLPAAANGQGSQRATMTVTASGGATAQIDIQVRDRLIVSFGDSFASGEGNPDIPVSLAALTAGWGIPDAPGYKQVWPGRDAMNGVRGATWIDTGCHRSSFNQHLVAALRYAADRPQEAVTFLSYACSGAAVYNGLLTPQAEPPGYKDEDTVKAQDTAQIEMATHDLCPPGPDGKSTAQETAGRTYTRTIKPKNPLAFWEKHTETLSTRAYRCAGGAQPRPVDAILLSDGGNDAGFSSVIMWALLPKSEPDLLGSKLLEFLRNDPDFARSPTDSNAIIGGSLSTDLQTLAARLKVFAPTAPVIIGGYPSPIRDTAGVFCGPPLKTAADADSDPTAARLAAINAAIPPYLGGLTHWKIAIDQSDGGQIEPTVVIALNNQLYTTSRLTGWHFVASGASKAANHGWCAGDPITEDASLPDYDDATGAWAPWKPFEWDPYVRRARFFRTPNDVALTQMPEKPRPLESSVPGLAAFLNNDVMPIHERALLAAFSGSFHPTFQAHVVMGTDLAYQLEHDLPPPP